MTSLVSKLPHSLYAYLACTSLVGGVYGGNHGRESKSALITLRNVAIGALSYSILYPFVPFIVLSENGYRTSSCLCRQLE